MPKLVCNLSSRMSWSTVSNAADKSNRTSAAKLPRSKSNSRQASSYAMLPTIAKFYGDRPRGTPPSKALNARGVANTAILDLSKARFHKRYKIDVNFLLKTNRKSYTLYRMVTLPISLGDPLTIPNHQIFYRLHHLSYFRNG